MLRLSVFRLLIGAGVVTSVVDSTSGSPDPRPGAEQWSKVGDIMAKIAAKMKTLHPERDADHLPRVHNLKVNMSDGAQLATTLIIPYPYDAKRPAALARSPYGPTSEQIADIFLLEGYVGVLQDDRGTFLSTGNFDVFRTAGKDGLETMEWISKQNWSNGEVVTMGISADGINEAAQVITAPPQLKGQWWMWTTGNGHHFSYPGGAFRQDLIEGYMHFMNHILIHGDGDKMIAEVKENEVYSHWWDAITVDGPSGYKNSWGNVKWPIILNTGWWDIFQQSSIETWASMRTLTDASVRDKHVHIVSPLGHCILSALDIHPEMAAAESDALYVGGLLAAEAFAGNFSGPNRKKVGRINLYIMGGFESPKSGPWRYWSSMDEWPTFTPRTFFLGTENSLTTEVSQQLSSEAYDYDPTHPSPMLGGNNLPLPIVSHITHCGYTNLASREKRADVITFDSPELTENTPVVGMITAKLFVSSSAKDTDFFVTVSDLSKHLLGDQSTLVRYGLLRMRWRESLSVQSASMLPEQIYEISVSLASTAYVFPKGHRIRVSVSSAANPYYNPNTNTGKLVNDNATAVVAHNVIYMGAKYPSQLVLPVVCFKDIPKNEGFPSLVPLETSPVMV